MRVILHALNGSKVVSVTVAPSDRHRCPVCYVGRSDIAVFDPGVPDGFIFHQGIVKIDPIHGGSEGVGDVL